MFSKSTVQLIRGLALIWALATIPLVAGVYFYLANEEDRDTRDRRQYYESFLSEIFERESRFGDAVNARRLVESIGKKVDLDRLFVCVDDKDLFGGLEGVVCPDLISSYPVISAGSTMNLKFQWLPKTREVQRIFLAVVFVYSIGLLSVFGLGLLIQLLLSRGILRVAKRISISTEAQDLITIGADYPELAPVANALGDYHSRLESTARENSNLRMFEALGKMARQVAHDIRSPLGALNIAGSRLGPDADAIRKEAIQRINGIADNLLTFRPDPSTPVESERLDSAFFRSVLDLKKAEHAGFSGRLELTCPNNLDCETSLSKTLAFRILSNLINNSIQAMSGSGVGSRISVVVEKHQETLTIQVVDDGPGISDEKISTIESGPSEADPNKVGRGGFGFGLGLPHARAEIQKIGGEFRLTRVASGGTRVELRLKLRANLASPILSRT
ncbi:MAG: ATP-binding protein [Bdellovibrionales bacterium]